MTNSSCSGLSRFSVYDFHFGIGSRFAFKAVYISERGIILRSFSSDFSCVI